MAAPLATHGGAVAGVDSTSGSGPWLMSALQPNGVLHPVHTALPHDGAELQLNHAPCQATRSQSAGTVTVALTAVEQTEREEWPGKWGKDQCSPPVHHCSQALQQDQTLQEAQTSENTRQDGTVADSQPAMLRFSS